VEVGGTQIERTENGGAAVRIRDIVVRDPDGTVVASAPKAEVRVSGMSLLSGHIRAESLNLVGAELHVRIEPNGNVTVFAGADKRPIATATVPIAAAAVVNGHPRPARPTPATTPPAVAAPGTVLSAAATLASPRGTSDAFAALLSWIDGIGETGLDGHELRELGLKDGILTVVDERTGKDWALANITLGLERPRGGGVVVTVGSENPERPWGLTASIKPTRNGSRSIELEVRHVSANDLLQASRLGDENFQANLPLSASLRGEIGPDGVPQSLSGRIVAEGGFISDSNSADGRLDIDRAEFKLNWDSANRLLSVPFQILSGGNRITLLGQIEAPEQAGGVWSFKIGGGTVVLASPGTHTDPLILNRIAVSGRFDPAKRRFVVEEGDLGNTDVQVAMSGNADYSSGELHLNAGFAGKRMSVEALKRLWPVFVAPKVRDWFNEHLMSGTVQHMVIAVNAPLDTLRASGPPIPDNGLSLDAVATGCVIRPVEGLPALADADLNVHIVGRDAQIALGKATADLPSGRKLVMSSGLFEVPDTAPQEPPARVRFKLDGPVPAAAELLAMDRLRDASGALFDPATTHGTMTAQVSLGMPLKPDLPPGSTNYSITVDATNFSAEHMIMGQRVDAAALRVSATPQGFQLKGDVKIGGTPASLEYHKARGDSDADIRIQGMLDAAARNNLGLGPSNTISGSIPIRLVGRLAAAAAADRDGRFAIEADLTPVQIDGFLPGWAKPAGKPARATFTLTTKPQSIRIDDLVIEGAGDGVKGVVELDGSGELQSANFPSYGFSDGDSATLKVERAQDGALRVTMRGEVYDGRGFIKTSTGGSAETQTDKRQTPDVDLDLKFGAVLGFNGEALSNVDLKMSRRAGEIRSLGLSANIGRDAKLTGELRGRPGGRQVVYLQTNDAGALFRATDVYSHMIGGQMAILMDAPSADNPMQQGTLNVHDFTIHDEAQLQRAAANGPQPRNDMQFSSMRVDFTRAPGRVALRDGVVRGPVLGGTIDGLIDYTRDEVHLRGTLVPLYGPNNLLGQLPVVGLFLGGQKEGLVGVTYEVVGRPGKPVLNVNPISALAPGLLRKIFEYPAASDGTMDEGR
ncbi:MAG: AsmA-like C-terminal region-containing protein, partial [Xanthobacteraceae bacterium]